MSKKRASGRSLDEWMELVTECRQSGLTDAAWCNGKRLIFLSYLKIKRLRKMFQSIPPILRGNASANSLYKIFTGQLNLLT